MRSPLKSLVRLLVSLNDRWPIRAAFVWAVASVVLVRTLVPAVISLALPDWATMVLVLPLILVLVFTLVVWLLVCEPIWMWMGVYRLFGIKRHLFRESLRKWSAPRT